MPTVNKVKLTICGTEYAITSDEAEDYVRELGGQVDRDMRALLHADERISTTMAAVLVAITNADAAKKAEGAADNLRSQMKGYLDDNARARQELENARRETERLRREIDDLRRGRSQPHE